MPIDTSIYGMLQQPKPLPGPLDRYMQAQQVGQMLDQQETSGLQRQLLRQQVESAPQQAALQAKLGALEVAGKQAGLDKTQAETAAAQAKLARDTLAGVQDQRGYDAWRADAASRGWQVGRSAPEVFDPAWQRQQIMTADEFLKRAAPALHMTDTGGGVQPVDPYTGRPVGTPLTKTAAPQPPQGATWDSERGVWVQPPARGAAAPGSVVPPAGAVPLPPKANDVAAVRKEFNDLPEVKNFRAVVPIINSAIDAPDNKSGDIQFAYTIGKIFDPNSVVREGELKLVGDAANMMEKYRGELQALTSGKGRLTANTRAELLAAAQARVGELQAAHDAAKQTYEGAAKARGLPVAEIFIDMPKVKQPKSRDAATGIPNDSPRRDIGGKKYVQINGQWFEER